MILCKLVQIFFFASLKFKQFSFLWYFCLHTKKVRYQIFFSPLSFVAVFWSEIRVLGSGMDKIKEPGLNNLYPQHCCGFSANAYICSQELK
jgi:hypothetical protein